jgi:hypothetical protein
MVSFMYILMLQRVSSLIAAPFVFCTYNSHHTINTTSSSPSGATVHDEPWPLLRLPAIVKT